MRTRTSTTLVPVRANACRRASGSAAASTSIVLPASRTRMASACPTSSTVTDACRTGAGPIASKSVRPAAIATHRRPEWGLTGSGHHAQAPTAHTQVAIASIGPPLTAIAAPGTRARCSASQAVAPRTAAAASLATAPMLGATLPTTAPLRPSSSAAETSGPTAAFATGAMSDTIANPEAMTGTVVSCATRVSASVPATGRTGPLRPAVIHAVARLPNNSRPATASAES